MGTIDLLKSLSPVVLIVAITTAIVRVISLRGDLVQKWRQRVMLADAGLSEQAAEELRSLQREDR